jgi:drug/metabolite transporter (DMT)-like permease
MGFLGALWNYLMIKAFQLAPVATLAPFSYTSLLWATLLDLVVFSDLPDAWTLAGAGIIIASGLVVIKREGSTAG